MEALTSNQTPRSPACSRGFSLVELLVVISIAAILLALSVPSVRGLLLQGQVASASTALSAAADSARRLAKDRAVQVGFPEEARFAGVAMVVTPTGEIRMTVNEPDAREDLSSAGVPTGEYLTEGDPDKRYSGFRDIEDLDYIALTAGVDLYGIDRDASGNLIYLPAPFAIRFSPSGRIVIGSLQSWTVGGSAGSGATKFTPEETKDRLVVYRKFDDNTGTRTYDKPVAPITAGHRTNLFNPLAGAYAPKTWSPTWSQASERFDLPFGILEAVGAVRIVLEGEDPIAPASGHTDLIFGRYSGTPTRIQNLR